MTDDLHLARVEARYRRAVQEELGLEQGDVPGVTLSLSEHESPEEAELEERRLLEQSQHGGGLPPEQALHLEALRFQRRKRELLTLWAEPPQPRPTLPKKRMCWEDALHTPLQVLQGEAGSGKSTLLRRAAVRQAHRSRPNSSTPPEFVKMVSFG